MTAYTSADHPFGVEKIVVHKKLCSERVIIDPEDPRSVIAGLRELVSYEISKVVEVGKKDPRHAAWVNAVTNDGCLSSFEDWCRF